MKSGWDLHKTAVVFGTMSTDRYGVHRGYIESLGAVGAVAIPVSSLTVVGLEAGGVPDSVRDYAMAVASSCDSLLLTGGGDVDPLRYGQERSEKTAGVEPHRDDLEISLLRAFMAANKKILAVCRGVQILNVALGGTLIQDLVGGGYRDHMVTEKEYSFAHPVHFEQGTKISRLSHGITEVNSLHHQAIDVLSSALKVSAYSDDGVVEAVETDNVIGLQWHPERMIEADRNELTYFEWLIDKD
ncbi:putative glutamine amidotransferase [Ferrithrix thermotolerans DSM 19514]|uniref:Putative glutamine amidotransferase n=2 Tax=Ferrithrix TaxID=643949 RepID=A0A1M4WKU3_9ACTN|nr:putative glutamine amidotransferase [Ferrithrix thermotolerans DSM 19514]